MNGKKIVICGTLIIGIILIICFWPKKENKKTGVPIITQASKTNKYLYSWKSDKYIYNANDDEEVIEYNLHNFVLDFYEKDMQICFKKNESDGSCEKHDYTFKDNRVLNIKEKSNKSNISGTYYVKEVNNQIVMEQNNDDGTSTIFKFIKMGGK